MKRLFYSLILFSGIAFAHDSNTEDLALSVFTPATLPPANILPTQPQTNLPPLEPPPKPKPIIKKFSIKRQIGSNWCWAACIQNALAQYGKNLPQRDIVKKYYRRVVDQGIGNEAQVASIMNKFGVKSGYSDRPLSQKYLTKCLKDGKRVIGLFWLPGGGHVMNIQDVNEKGTEFILSDPGNGKTRKLTYKQLRGMGWHSVVVTKKPADNAFKSGLTFGPKKPIDTM